MTHSTSPSTLQAASSALQSMDNFPSARRVDWDIHRNTLLNHLFSLPYILLLELISIHRLQSLLSTPTASNLAIHHTTGIAPTPSYDNYVDIERFKIADMESALVPGMHIDVSFLCSSQKRELIWRLLLRLERMRDNALGGGDGDEEGRVWLLGKYLVEVMKAKYEEIGSMGRGGRVGPLAADVCVPRVVVNGEMGHLDKVTGVVELRMRANEVL